MLNIYGHYIKMVWIITLFALPVYLKHVKENDMYIAHTAVYDCHKKWSCNLELSF